MFSGKEQTAKDVDCILIFDEETGVRYARTYCPI